MKILAKITVNASSNEIKIFKTGIFKIKLTAPPEHDKANKQLIQLLSDYFKVSQSQIHICSGKHSKIKQIEIKTDVQ
ncbi:DUF167 domain-containing protein [Candidatus Falkowbacteria bacterium]|nr:DUF167 domain-containing protein [Candidatus Falkowbacteria bacterium]